MKPGGPGAPFIPGDPGSPLGPAGPLLPGSPWKRRVEGRLKAFSKKKGKLQRIAKERRS